MPPKDVCFPVFKVVTAKEDQVGDDLSGGGRGSRSTWHMALTGLAAGKPCLRNACPSGSRPAIACAGVHLGWRRGCAEEVPPSEDVGSHEEGREEGGMLGRDRQLWRLPWLAGISVRLVRGVQDELQQAKGEGEHTGALRASGLANKRKTWPTP